jgi:cytosine/adenosine deaminase-related metal-dependent hydrolase
MAETLIIRSDFLLPIAERPIEDAFVVIENKRITDFGSFKNLRKKSFSNFIDLKGFILLPGLINSHTHLELSQLKGRINYKGSFSRWIEDLIEERSAWNYMDYVNSVSLGIKELIQSGTTTVGDVTLSGASWDILKAMGLRARIYHEVIGPRTCEAEEIFSTLKDKLLNFKSKRLINNGISPHAPYSVSKKLMKLILEFSRENKIPLMIHLAESYEEVEFFDSGMGRLYEFLKTRNSVDKDWIPPKTTPTKYLSETEIFSVATTVVHFNFFTEEDKSILLKANSSIVYCPKSHLYFKRKEYPIKSLIEHGLNISIGTDSLASNVSLNMLKEMKVLREMGLDSETILKLSTINGAKALKMEHLVGSVEIGKYADLIGVKLNKNFTNEPYDFITTGVEKVDFSIIDGKILIFPE